MSRTRVTLLSAVALIPGAALLIYVLLFVPPYTEDGQLSATALLLLFGALFLVTGATGTFVALALHRRWPSLAGHPVRRRSASNPAADAALRQGILVGLTVSAIVALSILRVLDIAFLIVTILLATLVEAYAQTRR